MYYNRKKELIKNVVIITFILLIAIIPTYLIYNKFKDERKFDYNSESLDIIFNEKEIDKVNITKVTPLPDSLGLASTATTLTIKNNLTEKVKYKIQLADNMDDIIKDDCLEKSISKENIKVSIKEDHKDNKIYKLSELEDGIILETSIKALGKKDYSIRVWVSQDTNIQAGSDLHYHGQIKVLDDSLNLAINR